MPHENSLPKEEELYVGCLHTTKVSTEQAIQHEHRRLSCPTLVNKRDCWFCFWLDKIVCHCEENCEFASEGLEDWVAHLVNERDCWWDYCANKETASSIWHTTKRDKTTARKRTKIPEKIQSRQSVSYLEPFENMFSYQEPGLFMISTLSASTVLFDNELY